LNLTREIQLEAERLSPEDFAKRHPCPVLVATEILGGELRRRPQPGTRSGPEGTVVFPRTPPKAGESRGARPSNAPGQAPVFAGTMALIEGPEAELLGAETEMLQDRVLTRPRFVELKKERSVGREREVVVGRTASADVVISDFTVSSRHAVFLYDPRTGENRILDLGSTNGTKVGDEKVPAQIAIPIRSWDRIVLGRVVTRFLEPQDFHAFLVSPAQAVLARETTPES
jgi:hypothetical protein